MGALPDSDDRHASAAAEAGTTADAVDGHVPARPTRDAVVIAALLASTGTAIGSG